MTTISRRVAFQLALGGLAMPSALRAALAESTSSNSAIRVRPIDGGECAARIAKVQSILQEQKLAAILVEAGSSLEYFTGIRWWRSERTTAALIPAEGKPLVVTPFFEVPSVQETLKIDADIRPWHEDQSPFETHRRGAERPRRPARSPSSTRPATSSSTTSRNFLASAARSFPAKTSSTPAA